MSVRLSHLRAILMAVLVALVAAAGATVPAQARSFHVGTQSAVARWVDEWGGTWTGQFDKLDALLAPTAPGERWIREDIRWSRVQARSGSFDWTLYDQLFQNATLRGYSVLPLIDDAPAWVSAYPGTVPASGVTPFATFVKAFVARYGATGTGSFWKAHPELDPNYAPRTVELWNEVYGTWWTPDHSATLPSTYANMIKAAVTAGRAASTRVHYLVSATTTAYTQQGAAYNWADALYQAVPDLSAYVDGLAIHPYPAGVDPLVPEGQQGSEDRWRSIGRIHSDFLRHGLNAPVWITELGVPTCQMASTNQCQTEATQATWFQEMFDSADRDYPYVHAFLDYSLADNHYLAGATPAAASATYADPEAWFGLEDNETLRHKPAWVVFQNGLAAHAGRSVPDTLAGTASRTATTFTATFTSPDPSARFQCSLDGGAYGSCGSVAGQYTTTLTVKKTHALKIQAWTTDEGTVDPTPLAVTVPAK